MLYWKVTWYLKLKDSHSKNFNIQIALGLPGELEQIN